MDLERSIEELLHSHDCVIIPRFGGFIGSYSPAGINRSGNIFTPPSKSLLFNINLHHNDGLLAHHVAEMEKISYEAALGVIHEKAAVWQQELKEGGRVVLGRIGELVAESEGNVVFHQSHLVNFLPDAYGLSSFVSPAIHREIISESHTPAERRIMPLLLKWAAMLTIPIGLAAYMSIREFDRMKEFSASYTGIFFSPSVPAGTTAGVKPIYVIPKQKPAPANQKKQVRSDSVRKVSQRPYAIIVGAFRFAENAENLIASLKNKGYDAAVYDVTKNGLTRVTIGTFPDREEALELLADARKDVSSAWLLSK